MPEPCYAWSASAISSNHCSMRFIISGREWTAQQHLRMRCSQTLLQVLTHSARVLACRYAMWIFGTP